MLMDETNSGNQETKESKFETAPKWDYTSRKQTLYIGAGVLGLNLLVALLAVLNNTVPAVHSLVTGKPL